MSKFKRSLNRSEEALAIVFLILALESHAAAGTIFKPFSFQLNDVVSSSKMNSDFDILYAEINAKENRLAALETPLSTPFAVFSLPTGLAVSGSWATNNFPLVQVINTLGNSITATSAHVVINTSGNYRVLLSSSDIGCNNTSAFVITMYINGVESGQNSTSQCNGSAYEFVGAFSLGDTLNFTFREGGGNLTTTAQTQTLVRISFFKL